MKKLRFTVPVRGREKRGNLLSLRAHISTTLSQPYYEPRGFSLHEALRERVTETVLAGDLFAHNIRGLELWLVSGNGKRSTYLTEWPTGGAKQGYKDKVALFPSSLFSLRSPGARCNQRVNSSSWAFQNYPGN